MKPTKQYETEKSKWPLLLALFIGAAGFSAGAYWDNVSAFVAKLF